MSGAAAVRLAAAPFVLAIVTATLLVLSAPFVGQLRGIVRAAFPGHFVLIVGTIIGLGAGGALLAALVRIRDRRASRFGAVALALVIAVAYSVYNAGPNPESNAVERFHFLQYGLITFLFYRAWRPLGDASIFVLPVLAALMVSAAEEWLQWFIPNRVGELNDVLLNLAAITSGLLFSVGVLPPGDLSRSLAPSSRGRVLRMAAAALLALAAFFHAVHVGHRVRDAEVGEFASRYSREQLLDLQAERTARWTADPPPMRVVRLSREDQYLTEGVQHVQERNARWTAGDVTAAWLENRILEKYFAPVLDTPSYAGPAGHRWPREQRADAAARADPAAAASYVSDAYPYRIYQWHPAVFWAVVLLLTGDLLRRSFLQGRRHRTAA